MTEIVAAPEAPASAPAAPASPPAAPPASPPAAPPASPPASETPPAAGDFQLPDAYKAQPWAEKIKSSDDLWKALEGAQTLIGKKSVATLPDFEKATPQQIQEYFAQTRPAEKAAYKLGEDVPEADRAAISDILYDSGISAYQGNKVIEAYKAYEAKQVESLTSEEGFYKELEASFGTSYKQVGGETAKFLKDNMSPEDNALFQKLPNSVLGLVYRLTNNVVEGYGIKHGETGAPAGGGQGPGAPEDLDKQATDLFNQIQELKKGPHEQSQLDVLIGKRQAIFEKKQRLAKK